MANASSAVMPLVGLRVGSPWPQYDHNCEMVRTYGSPTISRRFIPVPSHQCGVAM